MAKVNVNMGGQIVAGDTVAFSALQEPWSYYKLEDGTVLKLKLVVSDVIKLPGVDPVTGLPLFMVKSGNILSVEPLTPKSESH